MRRAALHQTVRFGGFDVTSTLYDIDVTGYGSRCARLRLFDVDSVDERIIARSADGFKRVMESFR